MKRLMILAAVWALAVARPELYKEKEDFQFSRSSTDEGSKSGFYGAQRGNMGGNYERAHNMDSLAQNQMSGLVQQVEGELGDGAKMRTGSVYSAANSRGTYGSGHHDLSNLAGRNFQEGTSYGDAQSQSSLSTSSAYNAASYANSRSQSSKHSGYQATGHSGLNLQSDDLQALTDHSHSQRTGQYDYGRHTSQAAGYNAQAAGYNAQAAGYNAQAAGHAQSEFQQHAAYDASNTNSHSGGYGSNVRTRLISATPVRVIVTPGGRVAIPVAAQTYDLTQGSTLVDQNSLNTDAEVLNNDNQRTVYRIPGNAKHYESSYNYRKEWEKHDTIPSTVISPTTDSPFPKNSELYEDGQALRAGSEQYDTRRVDSERAHSTYGGYNAAVKSTSGQSRFNYDTQRNAASQTNANAYSAGYGTNHQETSSDSRLNGYNIQSQNHAGRYHAASADAMTQAAEHNTGFNSATDLNSQVENLNGKPKSYQSAYSYHKSWERQGDPYVIKPASSAYYDGQSAQRLTGSHYQHSHASGADCDENGHIRVARSYNTDQFEDMQQQSQNLEDLGQQSQNLEDFGQQQSQNLEYFGQQQQSQNLEDFGQQQQSQNLEDFGQQQQSQNLEDFGQQQQSQNLEDFSQQQQSQNLDYFGQQQQSQKLEDLGQQQHKQNLEDLGQQVENLGQQTEVQWESQQEAGQQTQNTWDNLENLSQQTHNKWEDMQHTWDKFEDLGQKPQENQNGLRQRPQDAQTDLKNNTQDQQTQDKWAFNFKNQDEQQNAQGHEQTNKFNQQETQPQLSDDDIFNYSQQSQKHNDDQMSVWDKFDLGSDQNIQQHKYNNEHTNSNGNPVNFSFVSQQVGLDQQPLNSGTNPESQRVYYNEKNGSPVEHITSTSQSHKIPDTSEQSNSGSHIHDGNFNIHTDQNQFWNNENSFQETHLSHQSSNSYFSNSHRQEQTTNTASYSHVSASNTISPNTAPIAALWDKLGNFEQTLVTGNVDKGEENTFSQVHTNTQNSYGNSMHAYHNIDSTSQDHLNRQMNPYHDLMMAVIPIIEKDTIQNKSNVTKAEKESSLDVGRGDIGPEDLSDLKPEKYPTNTPKSSETIENQDQNNVSKNKTIAHRDNQVVEHNDNTQGHHYFHQHHDFQEQKDSENTDQQNLHVFSLHETIEQPKQHDVEQHNVHDYEKSLEQHDFTQQENKEQILSDFGQQVNVEEQNLHDFGKPDNMEQQSLQDFGQQINFDQQNLQNFGKPDNFQQQSLQDFGQQVNGEQQNLHDFGKADNLEQQNLQDFGQQVNGKQQNFKDFDKQYKFEQQNLQDFGQQVNVDQQNLHDFDKQHNLQQQNIKDFGQQENLEQQNIQGLDKQDNLEEQNLQDFGQQAYLEQHNLQSFRSQDDLQHQYKNVEQLNQDPKEPLKYSKEGRATLPKNNVGSQSYLPPPEEIEQSIVKKQSNDLHSISAETPSTLATIIESATESTGFWKSIGNKFSRAKSKISSWF